MPARKIKKEGVRHLKAFAFYLKFGTKRSLEKVSVEFKVKPETVALWSRSFDWQKRIAEHDKKAMQKMTEKMTDEYFKDKTKLHDMKLKIFTILNSYTNEKTLPVVEAEKILKIVKTELGEVSSITQNNNIESKNPFEELLSEDYNEDI